MRLWVGAIQRVIAYDRDQGFEPDPALFALAIRTFVELCIRTGKLGVGDEDRITWLSELFRVGRPVVEIAWMGASAEANVHRERIETATLARFRSGEAATMRHARRIEAHELSAALNLTHARKLAIFVRPRRIVDGRIELGKRPSTGLPHHVPKDAITARDAAQVAVWSVSKEERRYLIRRLGYKADTIRRNVANLSEGDFWDRVYKREFSTLPAERLAGLKLPGESDWHATRRLKAKGPHTRQRTPGVTAARRAYAKATGIGMTKAKELTKDLSAEAILAMISPQSVTLPTRYACDARPDTRAKIPLSGQKLHDITGSERTSVTPGKPTPVTLGPHDDAILHEWYVATTGEELRSGTIRQWRYRDKLDAKLFAACEWVIVQGNRHPTIDAHARKRVAEYRQIFDAQKQLDRINRSVRGSLGGFVYVA